MNKEQKKAAIAAAIEAHQENVAAVNESAIPAGLDSVVKAALAQALGTRLARIFESDTE